MARLTASTQRSAEGSAPRRRRARIARTLLGIGLLMVAGYSALFQLLMSAEGQSHSWATAVYWTISTMSTLGYGDITFTSDGGRLFSMLVLVSGAGFIVVLLPFFAIQYIVSPWLDRREAARAPRRVPAHLRDHVILVGLDAVTHTVASRAERSHVPAVVLLEDADAASTLRDQGLQVMVGPLDSAATYRKAGADRAILVASTLSDTRNTNVAFTVRQAAKHVAIAVTADKRASVDVLELAGADHVLQLGKSLGQEMAVRVLGRRGRAHRIGNFGQTVIAEAALRDTPLMGLTLREAKQQIHSRVRILAIMRHGQLRPLEPEQQITPDTVLILAGEAQELGGYEEQFGIQDRSEDPVLILGGGRVGRAAARALSEQDVPNTIVEQVPGRVDGQMNVVEGDAADRAVLETAGLESASAVLVTSHDDDLNAYLTLYCRRLRPELQVVSRATHERNVATLYRAGADSVLSYATIGATDIWNRAGLSRRVVIAEGYELFLVPRPASLARLSVRNPEVHRRTGCHIVAVTDPDDSLNYDAERIPTGEAQLLVLGDRHDERSFRRTYLKRLRR
ncbi:MAG TPA: NAD-binding protein [Beutenbergiaceae bacterium]|nr:NAD-binding protein [Beutenbergiaceae bacterium]